MLSGIQRVSCQLFMHHLSVLARRIFAAFDHLCIDFWARLTDDFSELREFPVSYNVI